MAEAFTLQAVKQKMEAFCAYQERCHQEVIQKMRVMAVGQDVSDNVIVHLINHNFLNEERFACAFARGKLRIKKWGKTRIINELKVRNISQHIIQVALKEIDPDDYLDVFDQLSTQCWHGIAEKNTLKKRKKFCDYLLRKGYESNLIYEAVKKLEAD